jgi:hypothetical protein
LHVREDEGFGVEIAEEPVGADAAVERVVPGSTEALIVVAFA